MSLGSYVKLDLFLHARIIAFILFVISPLIFLAVMYFVDVPEQQGGEIDMALYILLIVSVLQPLTIYLIEKVQVYFWRKSARENKNTAVPFFGLTLIKFPLVYAIYVYGMIVYLISGDMTRAIYFYPIGIAWSVVHWPTRARFERFADRLSKK